jgi:5-hydroxyisourate hydrolase-like protein (transthyretin family)
MTVRIEKPALNLREEINRLDKPTGIAGEAMLRAETPQEQFNLIGAGRRNVIINGAAQISQRGDYSSATTVVNQTLYVDRWFADINISCTFQHTDVDIEDMPTKCKAMKYVATTSGTNYMGTRQKVENPSQYEGRTFTYSAYVRSNHASARLTTYMTGSAQVEYSTAHSGNGQWERLSTTFTVKSGVTVWYLDVFLATQGVGQVAIATGDYFEVTGVQLEIGKVATPFEHRLYVEELALCQRYFYAFQSPNDPLGENGFMGTSYAADNVYCPIFFPVQMRAIPGIVSGGQWAIRRGNNFAFTGAFGIQIGGQNTMIIAQSVPSGSGITVTDAVWVQPYDNTAYLYFQAEL